MAASALFLLAWAALSALCNLRAPGPEPGPSVWFLLPNVDVTVLLCLFALLGWRNLRLPAWALFLFALLGVFIRLFRTAEGLIELNYYRPLNLYLDLPLLPELARLLYSTVPFSTLLIGGLAGLLGLVVAVFLTTLALAYCQRFLGAGSAHRTFFAVAIGVCLVLSPLWPTKQMSALHLGLFGQSVMPRFAKQVSFALAADTLRHRKSSDIAATQRELGRITTGLEALSHADVFMFLVESYGATVFRRAEFKERAQLMVNGFEAALKQRDLHTATTLLDSSTYGGGSWLAHATLATGVVIKDGLEFAVLRNTRPAPKTLAAYFRSAGYRTVLVQPGTTRAWPEGEVTGFERKYYARDFDYRGPAFGWATMPDQYVIDFIHRSEVAPAQRPLFIEYALVSSHAPWNVQAPVVDDWSRLGDGSVYQDIQPLQYPVTWKNLGEGGDAYLASLAYDFEVLKRYIVAHAARNALFIVLGDHQPPATLTGHDPSPAVPVHLISRDRALIEAFAEDGYVPGMTPSATGAVAGLETFLPTFVGRISAQ